MNEKKFASHILESKTKGKTREKKILRNLLESLEIKHTSITDFEKPDFILSIGEAKVGVEVTEYFSSTTEYGNHGKRRFEGWRNFAEAFSVFLKSQGLHFYGAIHFKQKYEDIFESQLFKNELEGWILKVEQAEKEKDWFEFDEERFPTLRKSLDHIFLEYLENKKEKKWWHAGLQVGNVPNPVKRLAEIILEKNEKALSYSKEVKDRLWLIIFAGGEIVENTIGFLDGGPILKMCEAIEIRFQKIFVVDYFMGNIYGVYPEIGIDRVKNKFLI